jgi:hypothetical protein
VRSYHERYLPCVCATYSLAFPRSRIVDEVYRLVIGRKTLRTLAIAALTVVALLGNFCPALAETMTPQQYHKAKGPCACPDDKDSAGKTCGKRSAFCQKGGAEIKGCYRVAVEKRTKEACGS